MGQSMGMLDFFVLEAGEYLERLDALAQAPAGPFPNADEFVRIARAWRGGALMASQQPMARAAQGLEAAGRALKDARLAWDERVRGEVIRAIDDCKKYLHRIRTPEPEDAARAEEIGAALERLAGRTSGTSRATGAGLDAGGRAFVAREAAAIASALDRAAQGLAADRASREALGGVAPAMSALRGVAVLNDLPPLADLLAAVEGALKEVLATSGAVAPAAPAVFDSAAKALARAAREVVDAGRPALDSAEAGAFASALLSAFGSTGQILPIEMLFYDDAGPHVVRQGTAPAPLSRVELVSQGEFLERAADELAHAASPVVRDLRLFGMAATLRPLAGAGGLPVAGGLGRFADAGRAAIERGAAGAAVEAFAAAVADAARALRTVQTGDEAPVVERLEAAIRRLGALGAPPAVPVVAPAPPAPAVRPRTTRVVPELAAMPSRAASAAAPDDYQRSPVAAVAPPAGYGPAAIATAPPVTPAATDERDLAWGYAAMERLITERGLPLGSLDELLSPAEEEGVVPIESLAPDDYQRAPVTVVAPPAGFGPGMSATAPDESEAGVVPIESLAPDEDIVPIESLLYRGQGALRRALELKAELATLAAAPGLAASRLYELQREVFDLVELGLGA
ncbi:MAG TPA: hypothetical protein VMT21_10550 [Gemmatimonadales bacterium]|nr:hypothetical protein [Gemmatimonadales bacterium]